MSKQVNKVICVLYICIYKNGSQTNIVKIHTLLFTKNAMGLNEYILVSPPREHTYVYNVCNRVLPPPPLQKKYLPLSSS